MEAMKIYMSPQIETMQKFLYGQIIPELFIKHISFGEVGTDHCQRQATKLDASGVGSILAIVIFLVGIYRIDQI